MRTTGCKGNSIKVAAGHYVDLMNPTHEMIDMYSIAAALSKLCRFGGHCEHFYSVAEHCCLATLLAAADTVPVEGLRAILLHDATEAYVGDMVRPLKQNMPEYEAAEAKVAEAVAWHFGVNFEKWHTVVKKYDQIMLKAEKAAIWPEDEEGWEGLDLIEVRTPEFEFVDHDEAREGFLNMAGVLGLWEGS